MKPFSNSARLIDITIKTKSIMKTFQERLNDMLVEIVTLLDSHLESQYSRVGKYSKRDLSGDMELVKEGKFIMLQDFHVRRLIEAGSELQKKEV
jgi:hypothetical protein